MLESAGALVKLTSRAEDVGGGGIDAADRGLEVDRGDFNQIYASNQI